jgi:ankyrin repeat protein
MRLLSTRTFKLEEISGDKIPPYAILSHTWGEREVTFQDMEKSCMVEEVGSEKIKNTCSVAAADGFDYVWIDTCCINKTSSAELSEAINSMFRWYLEAEVCYAYLADVPSDSVNRVTGHIDSRFSKSRWFTRGWTLQELIAPSTVIFLDKEWREIGTKLSLQQEIFMITGVPVRFLLGDDLRGASIAQRMSWASKRETTRVEDAAYCLMGIFSIHMPMLYGEGERAFIRLQEEIMRVSDDHSLFAWRSTENHGGLLATSPAAFSNSGNIVPSNPSNTFGGPLTVSNKEIHLALRFMDKGRQGLGLALLHCTNIGKKGVWLAIYVKDISLTKEYFEREQSDKLEELHLRGFNLSQYPVRSICIRHGLPAQKRKLEDLKKCTVKISGMDEHEITLRKIHLHSNWELSDGLLTTMVPTPDCVFGRLLVVCRDGIWFQIFLKKCRRLLLASVVTNLKPDAASSQSPTVLGQWQQESDRIRMPLGGGQHVYIAIKKQVQPILGEKCLVGIVELSYCSTDPGAWLEYMAMLDESIEEETPLSYAAARGQEALVKLLLRRDVNADSKNKNGLTPLWIAAAQGHEAVVKLLLNRSDVKADLMDALGRTPLQMAAAQGHEAVVKLLLDRNDVKANSEDKKGLTPLWMAAAQGHEAIVKLLLDWSDVKADSMDSDGQTPLWKAADLGHDAIAKLLLNRIDIKADSKNRKRQTPIWIGAAQGHEAVVKLLLDRSDVKADSKDKERQTPLWKAAERGHKAVVKLLLDQSDVNIDSENENGQTPLWIAAAQGHEAVVKLLLDQRDVKADSKNKNGQTPLWIAAAQGHEAAVKLLLDLSDVKADSKDNDGQTPLWKVAALGHEAIAKLLLNRSDVKADSMDDKGQTPLGIAAAQGHETIAKLLLDQSYVKADVADMLRRTPLWMAAAEGHEAVVRLLLDQNDVKVNSMDILGRTLLWMAAARGHEAIVRLLLGRNDIMTNSADMLRRTPLWEAAAQGHEVIVKILLDRNDIEADLKNEKRQRLLWIAAERGHEAVVKLLLDLNDVKADLKDEKGQTPLWKAAAEGHEVIVKLLLGRNNVKADSKDEKGRTPLWIAAE